MEISELVNENLLNENNFKMNEVDGLVLNYH
jgi:hypothetical protein